MALQVEMHRRTITPDPYCPCSFAALGAPLLCSVESPEDIVKFAILWRLYEQVGRWQDKVSAMLMRLDSHA